MADLTDLTFWIPTFISLTSVFLFYLDMRRRQKEDRETSNLMFGLINTMKEELEILKQQIGARNLTNQQALLQKKEELQWKKLMDIVRVSKWLSKLNDEL